MSIPKDIAQDMLKQIFDDLNFLEHQTRRVVLLREKVNKFYSDISGGEEIVL